MYQVSEAYLTAMMNEATQRRILGTIGAVSFTENDILQGSTTIENRCAEESDMKIGGVYIGQLSLTFMPSFLSKVARDEYYGKDITISIGLLVGNDWVDIPCGIYTVQTSKISKNGVSIEAYDYMKKLDKHFGLTTTSGKIYDYLHMIEEDCGVVCAMTQQQCEALPNGDENISIYSENDVETYRDMLYWLAQTCGRFATINRNGQLELRKFGIPNDVELDEMHRDIDVVFSGYTTHYTGINVVDIPSGYTNYYAVEPDDGFTMNLGSNPFLQYGTDTTKEIMRLAVLNAVAEIEYTPYSVISARDPIFDLGDEISFSGGISGDSTGCVMSYTYHLTSYEFEGYGDDPALADGRSKVDKNISGLLSKTDSNVVSYYFFENIAEINVGDGVPADIGKIRFAAKKETDVVIQCQFKIDTTSTADLTRTIVYNDIEPEPPEEGEEEADTETVEVGYFDKDETPIVAHVRYYYDNSLVAYEPIDTWTEEGSHMFNGFYFLPAVDISQEHEWKVTLELTDGTGEIDIKDAHILISGQGLVGELPWDGKIIVEDVIGKYAVKKIKAVTFYDGTVDVSLITPDTAEIEEDIDMQSVTDTEPLAFYDYDLSVVLRNIVYNLITEDGQYNITTADSQYNITTED